MLELAGALWAIEVKLTTSPNSEDMARLDRAADMIRASKRILVSQTRSPAGDANRASCDLAWIDCPAAEPRPLPDGAAFTERPDFAMFGLDP